MCKSVNAERAARHTQLQLCQTVSTDKHRHEPNLVFLYEQLKCEHWNVIKICELVLLDISAVTLFLIPSITSWKLNNKHECRKDSERSNSSNHIKGALGHTRSHFIVIANVLRGQISASSFRRLQWMLQVKREKKQEQISGTPPTAKVLSPLVICAKDMRQLKMTDC